MLTLYNSPTPTDTDPQKGLTTAEARQHLTDNGPNVLETVRPERWTVLLLRHFKSLLVGVLAVAAGLSFALGDLGDGYAILLVLAINTGIGFVLEWNARQSMQALHRLDTAQARVVRDGQVQEISSEAVTPGDLLLVETGDLVVADAELVEIHQLEVDESTLTGDWHNAPARETERSLKNSYRCYARLVGRVYRAGSVARITQPLEAIYINQPLTTRPGYQ